MLNQIREARKNESGFTLIELLLVIIILGVLAGIVVFAVGGINDDSKKSACKSDKKNVEIAAESYYATYGAYAAAAGVDGVDNLLVTATPKGFLKEAPSTTNGYTITYASNGTVTASGACT
jgi:prepilin-type N-terminal cleavage/methylation domain-containing protein